MSRGSERGVRDWFDRTYQERGLRYLRPYAAYPVFLDMLEPARSPLLDLACGAGHVLRAASDRGWGAVGLDISAAGLRLAKEQGHGGNLVQGSALHLPFADGVFGAVTCLGALERFLDRRRALEEILRVSRPDAKFCFLVRNARTASWRVWSQWLRRQNQAGHQDALDFESWTRLFGDVGLQVADCRPDPWMRQRWRYWARMGSTRSLPMPGRGWWPLRHANEFVFLLHRGSS